MFFDYEEIYYIQKKKNTRGNIIETPKLQKNYKLQTKLLARCFFVDHEVIYDSDSENR